MDINRMIAELQEEKERLSEAILALERLAVGKNRPRVRSSAPAKSNGSPERPLSPPGVAGETSPSDQSNETDS